MQILFRIQTFAKIIESCMWAYKSFENPINF